MFNLVAEGIKNFYTEPAGGCLHGEMTVPCLPHCCVGPSVMNCQSSVSYAGQHIIKELMNIQTMYALAWLYQF